MFGRRQKKTYDDDDGRTIVDMNVDGFPWYRPTKADRKSAKEDAPTRRELFAMIRAWFSVYIPRILCVLTGFGIAMLLIYCWLHGWFVN